ncbi:MAG: PRC-barrel domain-containing protein [Stellaceae bacterium]
MIVALNRSSLLMSVAVGAIVGLCAVPGGPGWAADPATAYALAAPGNMSNQNTALDAVAQARMALKHRQPGNAREQIERAERALLNLQQIHPDPHLDDALKQLAAARAALDANDAATVEQRLAGASQDLEVAFASTTVPGTQPSPAIGDAVYDPNGQEIGPILTFVVDPNGQVQSVIISVGDYLGTGEKTVAVPRSEIAGDSAHPIFNGNKDELRQAQNYWGTSTASGTSMPAR